MMSHAKFWVARALKGSLAAFVLFLTMLGAPTKTEAAIDPAQGPGGPILVVTSGSATFGKYYAEILRTEGFNAFTVADLSSVTASTLAAYDVVLLANASLTAAQVTMLTTWVSGGGNLIAMAPDAKLAGLLGVISRGTSLSDGYLLVDTTASPGKGIVAQTMQFHGTAARYMLNGATRLATLYSTATSSLGDPAVTMRSYGSGRAAAFVYDLAASVVYTRQGNPKWAAQERDGVTPIRSDDKFYGNASADPQPNWVDLSKIAIPQADEQQRLLANLILYMNASKKPLPRFWYFPNGKKAVVIMTGDDHGNGGTVGRLDQFKSRSPAGCSVANWECVRGTSYMYPSTPLSDAQASQYVSDGFEIGLHINTGCADFTSASLQVTYSQQVSEFVAKFPNVGPLLTQRHHCVVWSDWTSGADVELNYGMRLDTSYYFWPPGWVADAPGLFTGSGMPMRFARLDGSLVDVYMAATQMTDESGQSYPFTVDTLLDRALGSQGYFGAFTVNAHTDNAASTVSDAVVTSALARSVPIVSAGQMLTWLDARNASTFSAISYSAGTLNFTVNKAASANGLRGMLPVLSGGMQLDRITRAGAAVSFSVNNIKGVDYAFFAADAGAYVAFYKPVSTLVTTPVAGATGVSVATQVTVTFDADVVASSVTTSTFDLRDSANALVSAKVAYDATIRKATLTPSSVLQTSTTYTATVHGGSTEPTVKYATGTPLANNVTWSFTTASTGSSSCPSCSSAWGSSDTPAIASFADSNPVELGVRFTSDTSGYITGIRFYKGATNTGTHIGNLWTASGSLLASANFTSETASGWQQVNFATPVAINANTVYVASYFAPNGNYAVNSGYFASSGVDNSPIHLLSNAAAGGNGVYQYGASSSFPSSSYNATNYWVDIVFSTSGPPDTTPPTVISVSPASGATGISTSTGVSATFSESIDPTTINASTFELRNPANVLVTTSVSYNALTKTAAMTSGTALSSLTTYTATLKGGTTDPRVKDLAGNALTSNVSWAFTTGGGSSGGGCTSPANEIVAENCRAGNPASEWDISGIGDASIQGFATDISVNRGGTVSFKVNTTAANYRFDIYRMGYYGGAGARKVATVSPSASLPQTQPACLNQTATGLIECGNWSVSGSWTVPATLPSGIYFAKVIRADTGGASHIVFVVRDDASTSTLLFQTSDTTWQAYNNFGGNSLYEGQPAGRAYKVSYNRPFYTRAVDGGQDWVFNAEYPMVRWLEANGYDVSYITGIDSDRYGSLLLKHKTFLSVGHDEYWSGGQRANVTSARNAGVNLAFFSGNEIFWKTRWEPSVDGSSTAYRTLVCYKETHANAKIDPSIQWTGTWRDPRFSPPSDGGRPENELSGTLFMVNDGATTSIVVPSADGKMRFWRNTAVASGGGTMPFGTLGYEWDVDADNSARPPGLIRLSTTTVTNAPVLQDQGSTYATGTAVHSMTFYKHSSGAKVFGAGTVQWPWGLDATHDRAGTATDANMRQSTVNLLADMGAQPATLQSGLVVASASTDTASPTSTMTTPSAATVGTPLTLSGTAGDTGGGVVGGVEVSVDGGTSWRRATGRASWTYTWTPTANGTYNIKSRAADDSGNLETPSGGISVTVASQTCPCNLFSSSAVPAVLMDSDTNAVNLGVRFTSDRSGYITGIRFYKGSGNTGTHVGALWTSSGTMLATAVFSGESASGWQQANFTSPVAVSANTVYVASYLAPNGRYPANNSFFATTGTDNPPLHAPSGSNGVYVYGSSLAFPTSSYQSTNYWVDVVFSP